MRLDLAASHEVYLVSIGYSPEEAHGAVNRAIGQAERLTKRLPHDMQDRAFDSLLAQELDQCQAWIDKTRASAVNSEEHARRWAEGYKHLGIKPGPKSIAAYQQAALDKGGK